MTFKDFELRYLICAIPTLALLVQFIPLAAIDHRRPEDGPTITIRGKEIGVAPMDLLYYVYGIIFVIQDVAYNAVCGWIMFKEPPREWLFTTRLKRLDAAGELPDCTIRFKHVLNEIDPGHV